MLSIIVPCYNEEESIDIFYNKISEILSSFCNDYELIFVDDGSTDLTLDKIKNINNDRVKFVSFSRNFGKEAALLAGFEKAKGEYISLLDVDMQDPVELLPKMYKAVTEEGYDMAGARRISREGEPPVRSYFAGLFYQFMQKGLKINLKNGTRDYHLMNRKVLNAILSMREKTRFSKAIFPWVGFKTKYFEFKNIERAAGDTKWSFTQLVLYALDGISAFSDIPLYFMSFCGVLLFAIAMLVGLFILITDGLSWKFFATEFLGIQMFFFAIIAQYIAKIYTETKNRPHYLIKEESL